MGLTAGTFGKLVNKLVLSPAKVFDNFNIKYKLILSYFFITIIPVAAISLFAYNTTLSYVKGQSTAFMTKNLEQYRADVVNRLNTFIKLTDTIYIDSKVQNLMAWQFETSYDEYDLVTGYVTPLLTSLIASTGKNVNLDMIKYQETGSEIINNNYSGIGLDSLPQTDITTGSFNIYNAGRVKNREWFKELAGKNDGYIWIQADNDAKYNNISLIRPLVNLSDFSGRPTGLMKMTLNLEDIIETGSPAGEKSDEFNMVFDGKGNLFSKEKYKKEFYAKHTDTVLKLLDPEKPAESIFMKDYVLIGGKVDITGWKIISVNPIRKFNEIAEGMRNTTILYCLAAILLLLLVTGLLSTSFSRRISRISENMDHFRSGDFEGKIIDAHNDEIGYLAASFNEMAQRIKSLIKDNYQACVDRKEAQFIALQAQINPHFLYNSLSSISRLANIRDIDGINSMVKALTTFYRMSLNKGRDIISIYDELEHLKAYVNVFKIRKGEDFNVFYEIDEGILQFYTVKVILQPFMENALEHGIYNRTGPINIRVLARDAGENIEFGIIDDGIGMKSGSLKNIFSSNAGVEKGYGIKNVNERIKLQFGSKYGVEIFSRPGVGTAVTIMIPKVRQP